MFICSTLENNFLIYKIGLKELDLYKKFDSMLYVRQLEETRIFETLQQVDIDEIQESVDLREICKKDYYLKETVEKNRRENNKNLQNNVNKKQIIEQIKDIKEEKEIDNDSQMIKDYQLSEEQQDKKQIFQNNLTFSKHSSQSSSSTSIQQLSLYEQSIQRIYQLFRQVECLNYDPFMNIQPGEQLLINILQGIEVECDEQEPSGSESEVDEDLDEQRNRMEEKEREKERKRLRQKEKEKVGEKEEQKEMENDNQFERRENERRRRKRIEGKENKDKILNVKQKDEVKTNKGRKRYVVNSKLAKCLLESDDQQKIIYQAKPFSVKRLRKGKKGVLNLNLNNKISDLIDNQKKESNNEIGKDQTSSGVPQQLSSLNNTIQSSNKQNTVKQIQQLNSLPCAWLLNTSPQGKEEFRSYAQLLKRYNILYNNNQLQMMKDTHLKIQVNNHTQTYNENELHLKPFYIPSRFPEQAIPLDDNEFRNNVQFVNLQDNQLFSLPFSSNEQNINMNKQSPLYRDLGIHAELEDISANLGIDLVDIQDCTEQAPITYADIHLSSEALWIRLAATNPPPQRIKKLWEV